MTKQCLFVFILLLSWPLSAQDKEIIQDMKERAKTDPRIEYAFAEGSLARIFGQDAGLRMNLSGLLGTPLVSSDTFDERTVTFGGMTHLGFRFPKFQIEFGLLGSFFQSKEMTIQSLNSSISGEMSLRTIGYGFNLKLYSVYRRKDSRPYILFGTSLNLLEVDIDEANIVGFNMTEEDHLFLRGYGGKIGIGVEFKYNIDVQVHYSFTSYSRYQIAVERGDVRHVSENGGLSQPVHVQALMVSVGITDLFLQLAKL